MAAPYKHKLAAARFEYEYLGKTAGEIALAYDYPLAALREEMNHKQWERRLAPTELPDTKDIELFAKQLESITRSKLTVISLFRQIEQQPLLAEIEKAMLEKVLEITVSVNAKDDRCANKLLSLAKAVESMQARNPIDLADAFKDALGNAGTGIVVNIANQIQ